MGFFDKLKKIVNNKEKEVETKEEVESYSKGLEKTRNEFVSKLNVLGIKYTKIDEAYFEELEQILIMADIGVNTVENILDRLRARVKKENITIETYTGDWELINNNIMQNEPFSISFIARKKRA